MWLNLKPDDIYKRWDEDDIFLPEMRSLLDGVLHKSGLFDDSPLRETLKSIINLENMQLSDRILITGATDLTSAKYVEFNKTFDSVFDNPLDALLASQAIPGVFPPVISKDGRAFVSGALKDNSPVLRALTRCSELGFDDIEITAVISLSSFSKDEKTASYENANTLEVLWRFIEILLEYFTIQDLQLAKENFPTVSTYFYFVGDIFIYLCIIGEISFHWTFKTFTWAEPL